MKIEVKVADGNIVVTLDDTPDGPRCTLHVEDTYDVDEPINAMASMNLRQLRGRIKVLDSMAFNMGGKRK